jgi:hypothetical protein
LNAKDGKEQIRPLAFLHWNVATILVETVAFLHWIRFGYEGLCQNGTITILLVVSAQYCLIFQTETNSQMDSAA